VVGAVGVVGVGVVGAVVTGGGTVPLRK